MEDYNQETLSETASKRRRIEEEQIGQEEQGDDDKIDEEEGGSAEGGDGIKRELEDSPPPMPDRINEADLMRILVASDLHIGYMEKDRIRSQDTIETFEEILQIGKRENVDFILLGGDLFDENKPSRHMFYQVIRLLRKYCLNDRPVQVKFVSDASQNFKHSLFPTVNYEDGNLNVGMPIFSIHGNHDDMGGTSTCPLDLMHETGLINFFGKFTDVAEEFNISPLLFEKGETKLALYGLSYQKDERLHRDFGKKRVSFMRPTENKQDWFNILTLHQNRQMAGRRDNSYIPERFLPTFLDVIVWGHEHACRIDAERMDIGKDPRPEEELLQDPGWVIQPGSTVITQLNQEEFLLKKYVAVLNICGKRFKVKKVPLETVRQYYYEDIALQDYDSLKKEVNNDGSEETDEQQISRVDVFLRKRVDALLEKAKRERNGHPKQPKEPLIRIRVDFSGFQDSWFSKMALGARYVDRVANPKDIILSHNTRGEKNKVKVDREAFGDVVRRNARELQASVEDVVKNYFESLEDDEERMMILSERAMSQGSFFYVQKGSKKAINNVLEYQLEKIRGAVRQHEDSMEEERDVEEALGDLRQMRLDRYRDEAERRTQEQLDEQDLKEIKAHLISQSQKQRGNKRNRDFSSDEENVDDDVVLNGAGCADDDDHDDGDDSGDDPGPSSSRTRGGRGRGRPRGSRAATATTRARGRGSRGGRGREKTQSQTTTTNSQARSSGRSSAISNSQTRTTAGTSAATNSQARGSARLSETANSQARSSDRSSLNGTRDLSDYFGSAQKVTGGSHNASFEPIHWPSQDSSRSQQRLRESPGNSLASQDDLLAENASVSSSAMARAAERSRRKGRLAPAQPGGPGEPLVLSD